MLSARVSKWFFYAGITLLMSACLIFVGELFGLLPLPDVILNGETTLHSIVRLAVMGCVLAAIGSANE